jgi:hypothetical protein
MRSSVSGGFRAIACALAGMASTLVARADDVGRYPNWTGQWARVGSPNFDPTKPPGKGQQVPLTPEAQAAFDKIAANRAQGGLENSLSVTCVPNGMPRMMIDYETSDFFVTPAATYLWFDFSNELRRIYTDGRAWPAKIEPSFSGYSIGVWKDSAGSGRFDTLEVETRGLRGPRTFDGTGVSLHADNQSVIKERFFNDKADPGLLRDEITVEDHALTRPYTVTRAYKRVEKIVYTDNFCALDTSYVILGDENYFVGADGYMMPAKKGQKPPDLRYFGGEKQQGR